MSAKKDGFTLAKEIRIDNDETPIIFLTAKSQTQDVVEGFYIGGNDYLKNHLAWKSLSLGLTIYSTENKLQKSSGVLKVGLYTFDFPKQTCNLKMRKKFN